jgi:uncharacterized protein (TIRG00374 family)
MGRRAKHVVLTARVFRDKMAAYLVLRLRKIVDVFPNGLREFQYQGAWFCRTMVLSENRSLESILQAFISNGQPEDSSVTPNSKPRTHAAYWVVSLALAAVFLYYSLRGIDWRQVWGTLRGAQPPLVAAAAGLSCLALFLRSFRWRVLLSAQGQVSVAQAFWATAAGYLGNNVLPARAGEVIRSLMISSSSGMSRTFVLTTALSERMVDAIALITISAVVLLIVPLQAGWMMKAARPFALLGLVGVAAIALLPMFETFWFRLLGRLPVPERLRGAVEGILRQVLQGIRSFHDAGRLASFLLLTAVIWLLDALVTVTLARSLGIIIPLPVAFLLVAGLGLGSALPSTPGYVGVYQFVAVKVLTPFGLTNSQAIAYIFLFQAMNYAVILFWGLLGLAQRRAAGAAGEPVTVRLGSE